MLESEQSRSIFSRSSSEVGVKNFKLRTPLVSCRISNPDPVHAHLCRPVSSEISDLCELSDLLLFVSNFPSQIMKITAKKNVTIDILQTFR